MKKEEIVEILKEKGIEIPTKANKTQLEEMLTEVLANEVQPEEGEGCEVFGAFDGNSPDCKDCPRKIACKDETEKRGVAEEKTKPKAKKAEEGPRTGKVKSIKKFYKDFDDFLDDMNHVEAGSMCLLFDKMMIEGATIAEMLEAGKARAEELNVREPDKTQIKAHFAGRKKTAGMIIDETVDGKFVYVGLSNEGKVPRTDTAAYKRYLEDRAAAEADKAVEAAEEAAEAEEVQAEAAMG